MMSSQRAELTAGATSITPTKCLLKPSPGLRTCSQAQGRLLGMLGAVGSDTEVQSSMDALLQNIVTSLAIEGEQLNVGSVRSSLARRLGLTEDGRTPQAPKAWRNYCSMPPAPISSRSICSGCSHGIVGCSPAILNSGERSFANGISAAQYQAVAKV